MEAGALGTAPRIPLRGGEIIGRGRGTRRLRPRYRRICFTLNNWTPLEYQLITEMKCTWMIVGKEIGEEDNTPHLQGAIIFGVQMEHNAIKKLAGFNRAHFESMIGTPEHSIVYCTKQDPAAFTKGALPNPGKRNDLNEAVESIRAGSTMRQMAENHGVEVVKYHKGLTVLRSLLVEPRTKQPKIIWIYGPTGTGKTRCCTSFADEYMGGDSWMSNGSLQWLDGYDGQRCAIVDDFRAKHCSFPFLLRLLDRYPLRVPFKGGFVEWTPSVILVTTPHDPEQTFAGKTKYAPEDMEQLNRRISATIHLKAGVSPADALKLIVDGVYPPPEPVYGPVPTPPLSLEEVEESLEDSEESLISFLNKQRN